MYFLKKRSLFVTVYLINVIGSDIYKIGYTINPIAIRKSGIKSRVGPVKVIGTTYCDFKHESILHRHFNLQKIYDGIYAGQKEFFRLSKSDVIFVLEYFKQVGCLEPIMDNNHPKWKEFLRSISFWVDRISKRCTHTHLHTINSLKRYKGISIEKSLEFLKSNGGICDCQILRIASNIKR